MTHTEIATKCFEMLAQAGFKPSKRVLTVDENKDLAGACGTCTDFGDKYMIRISKDCEDVEATIMHECIHTIKGATNHGKKFKAIAAEINKTCPVEYRVNFWRYN